ncbi:MAG: MerR family transcriptional regulator [Eubacterium sp.]|nr:MerR family transcriptional regulator [Candidatus Colimonas fimequi]
MEDKLYSIGQASKICDVSQRMLRYYEELGIIKPDKISEESHYRYYSISTLRNVQAIRYFLDQGFSLEQIKSILLNDDIDAFQALFMEKIEETGKDIERYYQRLESLKGWCALLMEGKQVLKHPAFAPTIKYIPETLCFYYKRDRVQGESNSEIHIEIEYYTESKQDGHSMTDVGGAFNLYYESFADKLAGTHKSEMIIQLMYENSSSVTNTMNFGGFNAISAYHIGPPEDINQLYEKMIVWADKHNFQLRGDSIERHVLDIYSVRNPQMFVTELILPVIEDVTDMDNLTNWKQLL